MQIDMVSIGLGFFEGIGVVISPCILPILPIILAGSITGNNKRPFGILVGFVCIFALFTFFSRSLIQWIPIDPNLLRHLSFGMLMILGLIMLSTRLSEKFAQITQNLADTGSQLSVSSKLPGGFWGGFLFGGLVALIWTPCAGPILATIIVQVAIQKTNFTSFLTLLAFGIGAGVPMLIIALYGRDALNKLSYFKTHATLCRKFLGAVIILSVVYMFHLEGGGVGTTDANETSANKTSHLQHALPELYPAPAIAGIDAWINSPPLTISDLKGKVVLVDFWTYSCINCIRTLPYIKSWYKQYHDKGLVIIGVHTPEFDFEKNLENVKNAVRQDGIEYPVALDNHFATWQNYNNRFWPAHYLIDKNGYVVYTHFGEGDYDLTENAIRYLLDMKETSAAPITSPEAFDLHRTPETYLGYLRAQHFSKLQSAVKNEAAQYTFPSQLALNDWALQGNWIILGDRIVSNQNDAELEIHFSARNVFIVMGNASQKPISVKVFLNDKPVEVNQGKDVTNSSILVNEHSIFQVLTFPQPVQGVLRVVPSEPGLEIYTFTFG